MLQPLDVSLNKPFKDRVRRLWNEWMSFGDVKLTKGDNVMKPDITLCCQWVKQASDDIPAQMAKKSFLMCGISNAMDGSEDDAIFEESEKVAEEDDSEEDDGNDNTDYYDDDFQPMEEEVKVMDDIFNADRNSEFEGF